MLAFSVWNVEVTFNYHISKAAECSGKTSTRRTLSTWFILSLSVLVWIVNGCVCWKCSANVNVVIDIICSRLLKTLKQWQWFEWRFSIKHDAFYKHKFCFLKKNGDWPPGSKINVDTLEGRCELAGNMSKLKNECIVANCLWLPLEIVAASHGQYLSHFVSNH